MARLPYIEENEHPELADAISAIRTHRSGRLSHLYRTLLHSPPVAAGWLSLLTALRTQTELPAAYRELVILRVALVNRAPYEYQAHLSHAQAASITQEELDALPEWRESDAFDPAQRAVLEYVDAMTRDVDVSDSVFNAVHAFFGDRQTMEITAMVGAYNLVSRFLVALKVGS